MYARFTLHTADPARLGEIVAHYEEDVCTAFRHERGNRGMSVLVNDDLGVALVAAYWATDAAMRANDSTFANPVHDAAFFGATVSIEHFEIAKFIHVTRAGRGAAVSITRIDADPASVDEVLWPYEEPHVASLTDSDGFCTAVVLVDRPSGKIVIETTWRDAAASLAGRGPAAKRLLDVASKGTAFVRSIEQYRLDFHSVELE